MDFWKTTNRRKHRAGRRVARNMHWGGCFGDWKKHQKILTRILGELGSDWVGFSDQNVVISKKKVFTQIQTVFPSKMRWSPKKKKKKKKKKVFTPNSVGFSDQLLAMSKNKTQVFWSKSQEVLYNFSMPIPGGAISFLEQRSASKALKTWYFA